MTVHDGLAGVEALTGTARDPLKQLPQQHHLPRERGFTKVKGHTWVRLEVGACAVCGWVWEIWEVSRRLSWRISRP